MNLFYQPAISQGALYLDYAESHHALKVLRMNVGDVFAITDGKGFIYQARIVTADVKKCCFEIISEQKKMGRNYHIHIAIAPTKNIDRIEWFVEKTIEIGIDEISFINCKNSERSNINLKRIQNIAVSALKQSQQGWLSTIHTIKPFTEIISQQADEKYIAHADLSNPLHLKTISKSQKSYLVLIGPEGDFSVEELEMAIKSGFNVVSLGNNRLRTETAGVVACHTLHLANC